jgi:hypothetical protein
MAITLKARHDATIDPILAKAYKIIDQAWLDAGVTQEELDREDLMVDVYDGLIAQGKSEEEVQTYLKKTPWAEIERKYHDMFPYRGHPGSLVTEKPEKKAAYHMKGKNKVDDIFLITTHNCNPDDLAQVLTMVEEKLAKEGAVKITEDVIKFTLKIKAHANDDSVNGDAFNNQIKEGAISIAERVGAGSTELQGGMVYLLRKTN